MNFLRWFGAVGLVAVLGVSATRADAQVIFLGSGLGRVCSIMAYGVSEGLNPEPVTITGSNVRLGPLEVCNHALSEGVLYGDELAATYNNRGVIQFARGRYREATLDFQKALRLDASKADIHANLGGSLVGLKRWNEAKAALNKGIEMKATRLEKAYYNRAIVHEETNDTRGAYFDYLKASELAPQWEDPKKHLTRFTVSRKR